MDIVFFDLLQDVVDLVHIESSSCAQDPICEYLAKRLQEAGKGAKHQDQYTVDDSTASRAFKACTNNSDTESSASKILERRSGPRAEPGYQEGYENMIAWVNYDPSRNPAYIYPAGPETLLPKSKPNRAYKALIAFCGESRSIIERCVAGSDRKRNIRERRGYEKLILVIRKPFVIPRVLAVEQQLYRRHSFCLRLSFPHSMAYLPFSRKPKAMEHCPATCHFIWVLCFSE
jgi:hypothetical protein